MSGFLSKLFGSKQKRDSIKPANNNQPSNQKTKAQESSWLSNYPDSEVEFLIREIRRSPYVNHKYDDRLISHINKEIDIFSQDDYLKAFTPYGLKMHVIPKDILFSIKRNALTKFRIVKDISRSRELKLEEFKYGCAKDERDCDWCCENGGLIFKCSDDFIKVIEDNCTCKYNRSEIMAIVKW